MVTRMCARVAQAAAASEQTVSSVYLVHKVNNRRVSIVRREFAVFRSAPSTSAAASRVHEWHLTGLNRFRGTVISITEILESHKFIDAESLLKMFEICIF